MCLQTKRFWHLLGDIDGGYTAEQDAHDKAHAWASKTFTPAQLQDVLTISVNQARLYAEGQSPGNRKGYAVLYEQLVRHPRSLFREAVTPEFIHALHNGRFWEGVANADCRFFRQGKHGLEEFLHADDVLKNFVSEIDYSLAWKHVQRSREHADFVKQLDLGVSGKQLPLYLEVISRLYKTPDVPFSDSDLPYLLQQFALRITSFSRDEYKPWFPQWKKYVRNPIMQRALKQDKFCHEVLSAQRNSSFCFDLVNEMPDPVEAFSWLVQSSDDDRERYWFLQDVKDQKRFVDKNPAFAKGYVAQLRKREARKIKTEQKAKQKFEAKQEKSKTEFDDDEDRDWEVEYPEGD